MSHQTPLGEVNQVRWRGWIMYEYQAKGNKKRRYNFSLKSK